MKYLVNIACENATKYTSLLIDEIQRFDVRAEVYINRAGQVVAYVENQVLSSSQKPVKSSHFKSNDYDLLIVVGEHFNNVWKPSTTKNIRSCFFQITSNYEKGTDVYVKAINQFDKVFVDQPIYPSNVRSEHIGHYLNDIIRKYEFNGDRSDRLTIAVLINQKRNINRIHRLVEAVTEQQTNCQWIVSSDGLNEKDLFSLTQLDNCRFERMKLDQLKISNATIVDSQIDSITAALLNCPQVSVVTSQNIIGISKIQTPLVNRIIGEDLIKSVLPAKHELIITELFKIINDHEYCATLLEGYQRFKESVGAQPVTRNAARKIIEWLENDV